VVTDGGSSNLILLLSQINCNNQWTWQVEWHWSIRAPFSNDFKEQWEQWKRSGRLILYFRVSYILVRSAVFIYLKESYIRYMNIEVICGFGLT